MKIESNLSAYSSKLNSKEAYMRRKINDLQKRAKQIDLKAHEIAIQAYKIDLYIKMVEERKMDVLKQHQAATSDYNSVIDTIEEQINQYNKTFGANGQQYVTCGI